MFRLLRFIGRSIGYSILAALIGLVLVQFWFFLHIWYWVDHNPSSTAFMDARLERLREKNPQTALEYRWVSYARISPNLKRAIVVAEDAKFLGHEGFDWDGIRSAFERNRQKGKVVAGGSTISQQLAKNLFLSGERNFLRKGQELLITLALESCLSKQRILEIYLNHVEWGKGVFGAEAAARHYFSKPAAQLTPWESARLAVMLPRPKYFEKLPQSPYLTDRSQVILGRMGAAVLP